MMFNSKVIHRIGRVAFSTLFTGLICVGSPVVAEEELIGSDEFQISCAVCHGVDGRGNGNMAQFLNVKPADLTVLKKNSGGEYPFMRIFHTIDGRAVIAGHGERAMPVWGDRYKRETISGYGSFGDEGAVRGRILELVYYIQSIQQ